MKFLSLLPLAWRPSPETENHNYHFGGKSTTLGSKPRNCRPFILLPLYIYPHHGAWNPLLLALEENPNLHVKAVVNPNNGPGEYPPNSDYMVALEALSRFPNVQILGYVHVSWGNRPDEDVRADIDVYASWAHMPAPNSSISVGGIFFDEWPSDTKLLGRMEKLCVYARSSVSLKSMDAFANRPTIVCNPGTVVDDRWYRFADYLIAFENSADRWTDPEVGGKVKKSLFCDGKLHLGDKTAVLLHSAAPHQERKPQDQEDHDHPFIPEGLMHSAAGVFLTTGDFNAWCPRWKEFIAAVVER